MKALEQIKDTTLTQTGLKQAANAFVQRVKDGEINPLKAAVELKALETYIAELRTDPELQALATTEALKYGKGETVYGARIETRMTGVKYDYEACNDSELQSIQQQIATLKKKEEARQTFLKALTAPVANPETGELIEPPIKSGKESIVITLQR